MRCPDCNKFAAMESNEPETESGPDIDLDVPPPEARNGVKAFDATVTATVRISRSCEECGTELKGASLEFEDSIALPIEHADHDIEVDETGVENSERSEGKGRGLRTFFGAEYSYEVKCATCNVSLHTDSLSDHIQASDMEELV